MLLTLEILVVFIQVLFLVFVIQFVRKQISFLRQNKMILRFFSFIASIGGFCAPYITSIITRNVCIQIKIKRKLVI